MGADQTSGQSTTSHDNNPWRAALPMSGNAADWLGDPGLLTDDVRRSCTGPLTLDIIHDGRALLPDIVTAALPGTFSNAGWHREISMRMNGVLVVHARTFAPRETLDAHPWLEALGTNPLGHALAKMGDAARVDMQFCESSVLQGELAPPATCDGWSRRSLFQFDTLPLLLFEHFTTALLTQRRRRQ
ncbi:MAG: chorismate lyase [Pseudomonadota bacterium]